MSLLAETQYRFRLREHLVRILAISADFSQYATISIEINKGRRLIMIRREALSHGNLVVVGPLN